MLFTRITLDELYQGFCLRLRARGVAPETCTHYERAYKLLKRYFNEHHIRHVNAFTQDDWWALTNWLCVGRKPVTVNTYLRGVRTMFRWSAKKWGVPHVEDYDMMKVTDHEKEIYSAADIEALIAPPTTNSFLEIRGWMLSCLLIFCAPRAKSICALRISDFDLAAKELHINCLKNKHVATFPITDQFADVVREYLTRRRLHLIRLGLPDSGYFFFELNTGLPLSRFGLYKIQAVYNHSHGVTKTGLHIFRNNFAKGMIQNGADAFTLQRWLTHSHIKSTEVYVHLYADDLRKTVERYNPFEHLSIAAIPAVAGEWQQMSFFGIFEQISER